MVFEQNEILGLQHAGANVTVLSCRRPEASEFAQIHEFARPLVPLTHYFSVGAFLKGLSWCLMTRPVATVRTACRALRGALSHRARAFTHLAAWALSVAFALRFRRHSWNWVHANFAQGTATVAWYLSELLGLQFSFSAHAYDIFSQEPGLRDCAEFFATKTQVASLVFCEHEFGLRLLKEQVGSALDGKASIQRLAVRLEDLPQLPYPTGPAPKVIVGLGRLVQKKGFDCLIRAVAILCQKTTDLTCEIWGAGPEEENLRKVIESEGMTGHVLLKGPYRHDQLTEILRRAAAVVVPSRIDSFGDMDGSPTVILEAMAAARPVVASALSGIPEIVRDGQTGFLVESNRPDLLAERIAQVIQDPRIAQRVAVASRKYVEQHHSHKELGAQLLSRIRNSLDECGNGRFTKTSE